MPAQPNTIEIRITSVAQLFNSFDPSPFQARDLDDDAEEFITGSAWEFPTRGPLRIVVHLPESECETDGAKTMPEAVSQHFTYRADAMRRQLAELFRAGRRYLVVGLSIFAACTLLAQSIAAAFPGDGLAKGIEQGLVIIGWVANWKPFEILLYDWWPLRRRIELFRRLADAEIEVRAA